VFMYNNKIRILSNLLTLLTLIVAFNWVFAQKIVEEKDNNVFIWLEAENGDITAPMNAYNKENASCGQYIEVITGNYSREKPPKDGRVTYKFNIKKEGTYKLWGRVIASMSDEDAFWVKMDDKSWIKWADISLGCEWHWDEVHDNENDNQVIEYYLSSGSHELVITYLVDDVKLDKILLTSNTNFKPEKIGPTTEAIFSYNPNTPIVKDRITFDGSLSNSTEGKILKYKWNFGDGNMGSGVKFNHRYTSAGEYPVKLEVTCENGLKGYKRKMLQVYEDEMVLDFNFSPDHAKIGKMVEFDATNSFDPKGEIVSYSWDFGDGTKGKEMITNHKYKSEGLYNVELTATDNEGNTSSRQKEVAIINPEPKKIIYETDMCLDVDDVGGLAILHALENRGEADILAVCYNEVHPSGAAAIDAINTWYGRDDIPIGVYKGKLYKPDYSEYLDNLEKFPHDIYNENTPSAVDVYREVLSKQPDSSVTIVSVGFLNNLDNLLDKEPKLVARKVKELVIMGGLHNDGFNLSRHNLVSASQNVIENWPTPLVISQAGGDILTGSDLKNLSEDNPVREAYYKFFGSNFCNRPSWDEMAVLYGVRGLTTYFNRITKGKGRLPNGYEWNMQPGYRSYLKTKLSSSRYAEIIENLMMIQHKK